MAKRKTVNVTDLFGAKPTAATPVETAPTATPRSGKTSPLAVRVPDTVIADIGDIAQREGVAVADLLRFMVGHFIADYQAGKVKIDKVPAQARYKITE